MWLLILTNLVHIKRPLHLQLRLLRFSNTLQQTLYDEITWCSDVWTGNASQIYASPTFAQRAKIECSVRNTQWAIQDFPFIHFNRPKCNYHVLFFSLPVVLAPKDLIEQLKVCLKSFGVAQVKNGNYSLISKDVESATTGSKKWAETSRGLPLCTDGKNQLINVNKKHNQHNK